MTKTINFSVPVAVTVKEHPEAKEILEGLGFSSITNPIALATLGKKVSIVKGSNMKNIPIEQIEQAFISRGFEIIKGEVK